MDNWNDNGDMEESFNEESNYIDIREVVAKAEELPLSGYFLETRKNAKKRSAMSWLESCDSDTVSMICSYGKKARENLQQINESMATENRGNDVFDHEIEEAFDEDEDYYTLVLLIFAWENNRTIIGNINIEEAAYRLGMYAAIDVLKRNGIVESRGNGKLLSRKTEYTLTKKCQKMSKRDITKALKLINDIDDKK